MLKNKLQLTFMTILEVLQQKAQNGLTEIDYKVVYVE